MKRACIVALVLSGVGVGWAQTPSDTLSARLALPLEAALEDAAQASDAGDATDWTPLSQTWRRYLSRPLDLNRATRAELASLPGMNPLLRYRDEQGALVDVWELQAVPGFTREGIGRLLPFVTVSRDASARGVVGEGVVRVGRSLPLSRGFTDTSSSAYRGGPYSAFTRLTVAQPERWRGGVVATQDPGETRPTLTALAAEWVGTGWIKRVVAGDYGLHVGQGLLFSRGLAFARGGDPILAAKAPLPSLGPLLSTNRGFALRGAAVEFGNRQIRSTLFVSSQRLDATPAEAADSLWADPEGWTTLRRGGLYRTSAEESRRGTLGESLAGARVSYEGKALSLATTHSVLRYDRPRVLPNEPYLDRALRGRGTYSASVEGDWYVRNVNVFGELAYTGATGAWSGLGGALASLSERAEVAIAVRHLDAGHYAIRGAAQAARPLAVNNETGATLSLLLRPTARWRISAVIDGWRAPQPRRRTSAPSTGTDAVVQLEVEPRRGLRLLLRYRYSSDELNLPEALATPVARVTPVTRQQLRLDGWYALNEALTLRGRIEGSRYVHSDNPGSSGWGGLAFVEGRWRSRQWGATARVATYRIGTFGARIVAQEPELPYAFGIPAPTGQGLQLIAQGRYSPHPRWDVWLRVEWVRQLDGLSVGSGGETVSGGMRTDLALQVHYRLGAP